MRARGIALALVSLAFAAPAQRTIVVSGGGNALQQAVYQAAPGDTLDVQAGTYSAVIVGRGIRVVCRSGVNVDGGSRVAFDVADVPAGETFLLVGGHYATAAGLSRLPVLRLRNCAGDVLLIDTRPSDTSMLSDTMHVSGCTGPVVVAGMEVSRTYMGSWPIAISGARRVTFMNCTVLPRMTVTASNVVFDQSVIIERNAAVGLRLHGGSVTVRGGSITGGLQFSALYGVAGIEMSFGELTLTGGAVVSAYGGTTGGSAGTLEHAIETRGGSIRLDPSVQLLSVHANPIGGPATVRREPIPHVGTSAYTVGSRFTVRLGAEPGSLTATFVSWPVVPWPTPFGDLWIDLRAPLLATVTVPPSGRVVWTGTAPPLPRDTILVLQPVSLTTGGALVAGAAAHVVTR